jgi:hypothetical protein
VYGLFFLILKGPYALQTEVRIRSRFSGMIANLLENLLRANVCGFELNPISTFNGIRAAPCSTHREAIGFKLLCCRVVRGAYFRPGFLQSALARCARSTPRSLSALACLPSSNCQELRVIVRIGDFP